MILMLARVLDVPLRDRNDLLVAAGYAAVHRCRAVTSSARIADLAASPEPAFAFAHSGRLTISARAVRLPPWMNDVARLDRMALEQDQRIADVVGREASRLRAFIRRRVRDPRDVDDILQDVFQKLVEANRLLMPIDHVTAWLFRVARNRITDLFRKKTPESFSENAIVDENDGLLRLEDVLPSLDAGPEAVYARGVLLDELDLALDELPRAARGVHRPRARGAQLQGHRRRHGRQPQHAALAQTVRRAAPARTAAKHLRRAARRAHEIMRNLHMRKKWIFIVPAAIFGMLLFIFLGGTIVRQLWNWLLPPLFGFHTVTFWQAIGLLALCRILFGGFGFHRSSRSGMRRRMAERWEQMTPEERERFRNGIRGRFCGMAPTESTVK
jgi:RNA polymerase sigma factor (sigma-70 family)